MRYKGRTIIDKDIKDWGEEEDNLTVKKEEHTVKQEKIDKNEDNYCTWKRMRKKNSSKDQ